MEVDQIQFKFPRITNIELTTPTQKMDMDEEEDQAGTQLKRNNSLIGIGPFYNWPSSRIVRVSRASGGKDRHSKVLTSKGLRDRRVRLSVNTAIQFYDLQDRLGYDQPSKAVEWLLKAAATSIAELPPMTTPFPETPKTKEEKMSSNGCFDEADPNETSETSKGSGGISVPRSENQNRIKARERAKGRVADKEKGNETCPLLNNISQTTSFTELLSSANPMDSHSYFSSGGMRNLSSSSNQMFSMPEQQQQQYFSFVPDQDQSLRNNGNNLDFTMSSSNNSNNNNNKNSSSSLGLDGFNRGTLQSNSSSSSSLFPHIQRFHSPPPPLSFYMGTSTNTAPVAVENQAQFVSGLDGRLHLCYGDATQGNNTTGRHSGGTGKGKN